MQLYEKFYWSFTYPQNHRNLFNVPNPALAGAKGEFCFGYDLVTSNCIVSVTMVWYPEMTSNMSKLVSYIMYYFLVFEQPLNYLFHNYLKENWKLVKTKLKLNLVWNDFLQPIFDCVFFLFSRTVLTKICSCLRELRSGFILQTQPTFDTSYCLSCH